MDEVVIEYQLTFDESRRALLGASPKTNRALVIIMVGAELIAAASTIGNNEPTWSIVLASVEVIVFAVFLVRRFWLVPRRYWRVMPGVQEPRTVTFGNQAIVSKSESVETTYEWSQFSSTRETSEFFFLVPRKRVMGFAIAKRGLRSTEDEMRLRLLFESHAPLTSEDPLVRPGLVIKLFLVSLIVMLSILIYVEVRLS
jgi:hypothetical protein